MISSKDLLSTYNLLDQNEKKNYTHYEFQSFAYKLAKDLNDLTNLKIYMRLAKKVERSLMERAYSYALDAKSDNRGKMFMWKLKELRKELFERLNIKNFSYSYSIEVNKLFREKLAQKLVRKSYFDLNEFIENNCKKKDKILTIHSLNTELSKLFIEKKCKISGIEVSSNIKKLLLKSLEDTTRKDLPKLTRSDFLKNRFKKNSFNFIFINEYWYLIPLNSEIDILKEAKSLLNKDGKVIIFMKMDDSNNEEWKELSINEEKLKYLSKKNSFSEFQSLCNTLNFRIDYSKFFEDENGAFNIIALSVLN